MKKIIFAVLIGVMSFATVTSANAAPWHRHHHHHGHDHGHDHRDMR